MKHLRLHTMYTDVMLAVGLSCHINSDAGVASCVWHLSIFNLQQPSLVQNLGTMQACDGPPIFQPCDCWSWHALCCTLQSHITSFCHSNVIAVALADSNGRANWSEKIKWEGAHARQKYSWVDQGFTLCCISFKLDKALVLKNNK